MLYTEEEKEFVAKANEYRVQVEKNQRVILTKFLSLREQAIIEEVFRKSLVDVVLYGGYTNAERKRCFISPFDQPFDREQFKIHCFKLTYNKRFLKLAHPNVLGTLMSLKLDRSLFGDIVFDGDDCYIYNATDIDTILLNEFNMINQMPIGLEIIEDELHFEERYETIEIIVSSLRLDNVIGHVYKLSRNDAQKLVNSNFVYKNFQIITNNSSICKKDDIISVRKYGRFIVGEVLRSTKSNRSVLEIKTPAR